MIKKSLEEAFWFKARTQEIRKLGAHAFTMAFSLVFFVGFTALARAYIVKKR